VCAHHARVRLGGLILLFLGCSKAAGPTGPVDAGVVQVEIVDAGPVVSEARLAAWLAWQQALAQLPPLGKADAGEGAELRRRARTEAALLADAGLTSDQADAIEAVVAAVVAERNVARLTGAEALNQFKTGLDQLGPEQRAKAEAALADLQARSVQGNLATVESQYGVDAVRVVLTRESEVTKTWDALLEARGDKR
jgi:hypothetical protein